jgi:hypothetical protein
MLVFTTQLCELLPSNLLSVSTLSSPPLPCVKDSTHSVRLGGGGGIEQGDLDRSVDSAESCWRPYSEGV